MAHAKYGMSGLDAAAGCPGKVRAEDGLPDQSSSYAERGTLMHGVSEVPLRVAAVTDVLITPALHDLLTHAAVKAGLDDRELDIVKRYVEYVLELPADHREIEVRVTPSVRYAELCYGTADCVVFCGDTIHVIDLKTGQGVKVFAEGNRQLLGYGLGAVVEFHEVFGPFKKVVVHIVQPALDHFDVAEYDIDTVLAFEDVIAEIIDAAEEPDAPRTPNEKSCKFCRARFTCKARHDEAIRTAFEDFGDTPASHDLTLEDIGRLLPRLGQVEDWIHDIREFAQAQALSGAQIPGHKLVAGRANRRITNDDEAIARLRDAGLDDYQIFVPQKLRGITDLEKAVGKTKFPVVLDGLIEKPEGKPTLVPADDKRPALELNQSSAASDFA